MEEGADDVGGGVGGEEGFGEGLGRLHDGVDGAEAGADEAVVIADGTADGYDRYAEPGGTAAYAFGSFAHKGLGIEASFAGDDEIGIAGGIVEAASIEDDVDARRESGTKIVHECEAEPAGGSRAGE